MACCHSKATGWVYYADPDGSTNGRRPSRTDYGLCPAARVANNLQRHQARRAAGRNSGAMPIRPALASFRSAELFPDGLVPVGDRFPLQSRLWPGHGSGGAGSLPPETPSEGPDDQGRSACRVAQAFFSENLRWSRRRGICRRFRISPSGDARQHPADFASRLEYNGALMGPRSATPPFIGY